MISPLNTLPMQDSAEAFEKGMARGMLFFVAGLILLLGSAGFVYDGTKQLSFLSNEDESAPPYHMDLTAERLHTMPGLVTVTGYPGIQVDHTYQAVNIFDFTTYKTFYLALHATPDKTSPVRAVIQRKEAFLGKLGLFPTAEDIFHPTLEVPSPDAPYSVTGIMGYHAGTLPDEVRDALEYNGLQIAENTPYIDMGAAVPSWKGFLSWWLPFVALSILSLVLLGRAVHHLRGKIL